MVRVTQSLRESAQKGGQIDLLERRQRQPEEEDKLEGEVEGEPVDDADKALEDGEAREHDPVLYEGV